MIIHALRDAPPPALGRALAEFETRFTYPLGPGRSFRISHGDDYPRFFRAIGDARSFVAERDGTVAGALGVALRKLATPDGGLCAAAYVGDLKVDPAARGSLAFPRLAKAALAWAAPQVDAGYGVVMDGTAAVPTAYTGRAGVPPFARAATVYVLRLSTAGFAGGPGGEVDVAAGADDLFRQLSRGRYAGVGGDPRERSEISPVWLIDPDGLACGRLEDTRRAKRLVADDGADMVSAHLACFAFRTAEAGARVVHAARMTAAGMGFGAMFVCVAEQDLAVLKPAFGGIDLVVAPATVYAAGIDREAPWNVNSSEI